MSQSAAGKLYIVATPIGNLDDMTPRAVRVLAEVDLIAAEDTRHSRGLARHFGIETPMMSLHDHNEKARAESLLQKIGDGASIALVSDAGTPLISDPGYVLVREARAAGIEVVPVPGVSAIIAALCACGLPTDRFSFEGFLPARSGQRKKVLETLLHETGTLVFYESPHRIVETCEDLLQVMGPQRQACIARELTKQYESFYTGTLEELLAKLNSHEDHRRGEFVVIVSGNDNAEEPDAIDRKKLLLLLLEELPLKKAAALAAKITDGSRNEFYQLGLDLKKD